MGVSTGVVPEPWSDLAEQAAEAGAREVAVPLAYPPVGGTRGDWASIPLGKVTGRAEATLEVTVPADLAEQVGLVLVNGTRFVRE